MATQTRTCECGCGREVRRGRRFVHGHPGRPLVAGATASAIHRWVVKHHPKTGRCESCGREGRTDYAYKHHPAPHTRNREDYDEMCRSCHFKGDEPVIGRGAQLASSATSEQRRAAGLKGAAVRWGGENVGPLSPQK